MNVESRPQTTEEFDRNSPEERIKRILPCLTGIKTAIPFLMPEDGTWISSSELRQKFRDLLVGTAAENFHWDTATKYSHHTLVNIGEILDEDANGNFRLSFDGFMVGLPATALALYFEDKTNISLAEVFGSNSSNSEFGTRSCAVRSKILDYLRNHDSAREADIINGLGLEKSLVKQSLKNLAVAGAIEYKSVNHRINKNDVQYFLGEKQDFRPNKEYGRLSMEVAEICKKLVSDGMPISQDEISKNIPNIGKFKNRRKMGNIINIILSDLAKQGFLRHGEFYMGKFSETTITEKGKVVVDEFLNPLKKFLNYDHEENLFLHALIPKIKDNLGYFAARSAETYYPFSQSKKVQESHEKRSKVIILIQENGEMTVNELAGLLDLKPTTVLGYLKGLLNAGSLVREERKRVFYYKLS